MASWAHEKGVPGKFVQLMGHAKVDTTLADRPAANTSPMPDCNLRQIRPHPSRFQQQRFEVLHIIGCQAGFPWLLVADRDQRPPMGPADRCIGAIRAIAFLAIAASSLSRVTNGFR
jgi:hypothetical protein